VHFSIRHGDKADATIIVTALDVDLTETKRSWHDEPALRRARMDEPASCKICAHEARRRLDLIVTDGHGGLLSAVSQLFSATPRQRCLVQKQRTVLNAIARRERSTVQPELVGIWDQPTKQEALIQLAAFKATYGKRYPQAVRSLAEDEEHLLTFYAFRL
jgi:putative transposase